MGFVRFFVACRCLCLVDLQLRQAADDLHGFEADGDDPLEELERIGGIADRLDGIAVRIIDDAAILIGFDNDRGEAACPC